MPKGSKEDTKFPWTTAPPDVRYAQTNQTNYCYQMFLDYHRCWRLLGKGYKKCDYFKDNYKSLCPNAWVERWEEQMKIGTFPVCFPEPKDKK